MDFQLQINNAGQPDPITPGGRMIYFTITTSFMRSGVCYYNVTGVDVARNNYTALMRRSKVGEYLISQLTQV
jgi:hypothetical protein